MANTSLSLGPHWESFVKREIASGRYASTSEVVRAALRELEERSKRLQALQDHLSEGAAQARKGEFVAFTVDDVVKRAKKRAAKSDKA
jgi:antitoxin ParD1/3/4